LLAHFASGAVSSDAMLVYTGSATNCDMGDGPHQDDDALYLRELREQLAAYNVTSVI